MKCFDVIVLGGGPAGCAAALSCLQRQMRVLIITNSKTNRSTPIEDCLDPAQSISPSCVTVLRKLGLGECLDKSSRGLYSCIRTKGIVRLVGTFNKSEIGHHISRVVFDNLMLNHIENKGAVVFRNEAVRDFIKIGDRIGGVVTQKGNRYLTPYVLDATGRSRFGGRKLKLLEKYYSPLLGVWTGITNIALDDSHADNAMFIPKRNGWSWLARESSGYISWTKLSNNWKQDFRFNCLQKTKVGKDIRFYNMQWRIFRPLCVDGLLLTGDAGGSIDPASGRGVLDALDSGVMAAMTIYKIYSQPWNEVLHLFNYDDWFLKMYLNKVIALGELYHRNDIHILQ